MSYQIDQSGKLEFTAKNTYIALANGETITCKISAKEKRKLIKIIKEFRKPNKTYIYQIFASIIFILLKNQGLQEIQIDIEYPGHNASIKEILIQLFENIKQKPPEISFVLVGKKSNAHFAAIETFRREREVDITVTAEDILRLLYTKLDFKKGWRPRSGRGNP